MDLYWLYDLSTPVLFFTIVGLTTISGLAKTLLFPNFFKRVLKTDDKNNDFTIGFLSLTGAFLSITIGLIIVGTYENYGASEKVVKDEVGALYSLYKRVNYLEGEEKKDLSTQLKDYAEYVVKEEWPKQQNGIIPILSAESLSSFEKNLFLYKPLSERDQVVYDQILNSYAELFKNREERIFSVNKGLPMSVYTILILGLLINILVSWQIVVANKKLEIFVYTLTGILAGSLVFIIVAMDNPYRGGFSVSAEPFIQFLHSIGIK